MMLNKVSLNTIGLNRIGLNRIGKPSRASSDRPYVDPEVLASLKAVCICYGKSNDDPDRAVVKNLVDPDNPFVISNATFKLNSGFGEYAADFLDWTSSKDAQKTSFEVKITSSNYKENWVAYKAPNTTFKAMKVRISGIPDGGYLQFFRTTADGGGIKMVNGINEIPAFTNTVVAGFYIDIPLGFDWSNLVIEQIPSFEGAFVTDGVNDLITSTKTVQEMLGGSSEYTVLSMIHHIDVPEGNIHSNTVRIKLGSWGTSNGITSFSNNKTGIYGYTVKNQNITVINNILGDKNDYGIRGGDYTSNLEAKFSVVGWIGEDDILRETASIAWYWTIIANKVLTTDEINQVIAYYNLDRTLNPDILCNTIKQGITNENHAEFGDKLIDFSGNGRDIQLNNIAWKGDSGIGKYNFSNINIIANRFEGTVTTNKCHFTKKLTNTTNNFCDLVVISPNEPIKFKVSGLSDGRKLFVANKSGSGSNYNFDNGEHEVSLSFAEGVGQNNAFGVTGDIGDIDVTVEFIPSHAGALCLDGVNDFGKVTGMPIYKDYTVVADREIIDGLAENADGGVALKGSRYLTGAFCFDYKDAAFSFGTSKMIPLDTKRFISYQSKYVSNGISINIGTATDNDELWIGRLGNDKRYSKIAIRFLMSFPYSMSEFLIERQLKKHKLGTLYPDMVEFRPIVKSNLPYSSISYSVNPGEYISVDSMVTITVTLPNTSDKLMEVSCNAISDISISGDNGVYEITGKVGKSPQKINMIISSYLTMLSNSTLISNETLIKNE